MEKVLSVMLVFITLAMILAILLQRSEGGGLVGGGSGGGMMSSRGTANFLTKTTAFLGAAFMLICLILATLAARGKDENLLIDQLERRQTVVKTAPVKGPEAPVSQ
jgi:preprotein translocase subunit SecG